MKVKGGYSGNILLVRVAIAYSHMQLGFYRENMVIYVVKLYACIYMHKYTTIW